MVSHWSENKQWIEHFEIVDSSRNDTEQKTCSTECGIQSICVHWTVSEAAFIVDDIDIESVILGSRYTHFNSNNNIW